MVPRHHHRTIEVVVTRGYIPAFGRTVDGELSESLVVADSDRRKAQ